MDKNFAKVRLSAEEMRLVRDPAWILTKNSVMGKVIAMFGELSGEIRGGGKDLTERSEVQEPSGGAHRVAPSRRAPCSGGPEKEPKISRGENYKGLPWVMLDYPREFGREDVYAIRVFFLWGHAFSVTLHLKGVYLTRFLPAILGRRGELAAAGFELGISDDEWAHDHTADNYGPIGGMIADGDGPIGDVPAGAGEPGEIIAGAGRSWLKLSARVELEHWDEAPEKLLALHQLLMDVSCPGGGTDL